jgi:hypothetical protein
MDHDALFLREMADQLPGPPKYYSSVGPITDPEERECPLICDEAQ